MLYELGLSFLTGKPAEHGIVIEVLPDRHAPGKIGMAGGEIDSIADSRGPGLQVLSQHADSTLFCGKKLAEDGQEGGILCAKSHKGEKTGLFKFLQFYPFFRKLPPSHFGDTAPLYFNFNLTRYTHNIMG